MAELINPNPVVHERKDLHRGLVKAREARRRQLAEAALLGQSGFSAGEDAGGDEAREPIDALEVYEHIRDINDPEHPYTLEQLNVVCEDHVEVDDAKGRVSVQFTPTVAHCSMATLIGLSIRVQLMRALPPRFKVDIKLFPGSHSSEAAVNKQLSDKERVAAALENPNLLDLVNRCLASADAAAAEQEEAEMGAAAEVVGKAA